MTGKSYYITTLGDWQRHAARFANSHFVILESPGENCAKLSEEHQAPTPGTIYRAPTEHDAPIPASVAPDLATRILVLIEADEGVHLSLEDEPSFEALPHPLAAKPISDSAHAALAAHGVAPGATMFDAAEALARVHPLLRHRVF